MYQTEIKNYIKKKLEGLPYIKRLKDRISELEGNPKHAYAAGHFYSPIPSIDDILQNDERIFKPDKAPLEGIDLNEKKQLTLLHKISAFYKEFPYLSDTPNNARYSLDNTYYYDSDAVFLYLIMRHFKPSKIIEIGSGFSSALMLDTNEYFLKNKTHCTFIDPHPDRLLSVLNGKDRDHHLVIPKCVQNVKIEVFQQLQEEDILFIDSSHVSKINSDVNFLLFEILPKLNKGVLIHIHDVFYPFVYPKKWLLGGRAWNEVFILRAFLQYNDAFEIILFNTFLETHYADWLNSHMPLCLKKRPAQFSASGSIWLRKI